MLRVGCAVVIRPLTLPGAIRGICEPSPNSPDELRPHDRTEPFTSARLTLAMPPPIASTGARFEIGTGEERFELVPSPSVPCPLKPQPQRLLSFLIAYG